MSTLKFPSGFLLFCFANVDRHSGELYGTGVSLRRTGIEILLHLLVIVRKIWVRHLMSLSLGR